MYAMQTVYEHLPRGRTFIFINETNFNLYCKRKQGRSKIATRASIVLPWSIAANLHCIRAMSSTKLVLFTRRRGDFKRQDCLQLFRELANECVSQAIENPTFINDNAPANAPAHSLLEEIEEEFPNVKILRLAPSLYLMNPIELVWSAFKTHVNIILKARMTQIMAATTRDFNCC